MLTLVSGGSGSGKSAFAEGLILESGLPHRLYIATMEVWDKEGEARVARHRAMRADKGFETLELPRGLDRQSPPEGWAVLLEDLSNLAMGELYGPRPQGAEERILKGAEAFARDNLLVVVTNELFSDGVEYDPGTREFLDLLARLNRALAARAEEVWEVVCGIPIRHKGGEMV